MPKVNPVDKIATEIGAYRSVSAGRLLQSCAASVSSSASNSHPPDEQLSPGQWHEHVAERRTRRAAHVTGVDESGILSVGDVEALDQKRSVHARADAETFFGAQVEVEVGRSGERRSRRRRIKQRTRGSHE